ncbi:restriction endonuclease subunit S [Streptomyces tunisiensis]|uniref:restriction endonuclease subunit S n=1 Tax=Streptomyces tunisiensis TaxID=948699 RepID=UPI003988BB55
MTRQALKDLVEPVQTLDPKSGFANKFTYIDIASVDQETKRVIGARPVPSEEAPSRARQLVRAGDILVSTVRPNLNAVAAVPAELNGAIASTGFCVLRPGPNLDSDYLKHWVMTSEFVYSMVSQATGQSYPAVSDRIVKQSTLPVPGVERQRRIAAVLDQVDAMRVKRRQTIALLDALTQSIFLDMFGDQLTGRDRVVSLSSVADISSGITKGRKTPAGELETLPYLAVANVQDRHLDLSNVKEISVSSEEKERYKLKVGDLLLTEGGDPDKLGRGTLWRGELPACLHQNHIFRVRVSKTDFVDPVYLNWVVSSNYGKRYFLRTAKQTTGIASINKTQLGDFPLPLPDLTVQLEFKKRVKEVAAQQEAHRAHATALDELFTSLQQRAFSGTLWDHEAAA